MAGPGSRESRRHARAALGEAWRVTQPAYRAPVRDGAFQGRGLQGLIRWSATEVGRALIEHQPVQIYAKDGTPLPAVHATIEHFASPDNPHRERWVLCLLDHEGRRLDELPFDTLATAVEQAFAILGVASEDWSWAD